MGLSLLTAEEKMGFLCLLMIAKMFDWDTTQWAGLWIIRISFNAEFRWSAQYTSTTMKTGIVATVAMTEEWSRDSEDEY